MTAMKIIVRVMTTCRLLLERGQDAVAGERVKAGGEAVERFNW